MFFNITVTNNSKMFCFSSVLFHSPADLYNIKTIRIKYHFSQSSLSDLIEVTAQSSVDLSQVQTTLRESVLPEIGRVDKVLQNVNQSINTQGIDCYTPHPTSANCH